jgi:catechol 2,3-dioxygenase-like lactoylglutathione lyase family enzyme
MSLPVLDEPVKFHLSLNVANLGRSVAFYTQLFGLLPAKRHNDYAKFELVDPPVIFSLVPHAPGSGGVLSHIGLRVGDEDALQALRERIEAAGLCVQEQHDTVCGYARQNKCWVKDPDGNFWEIYHIEEDVDPISVRRSLEGGAARIEPPTADVVWEHYVTQPLPDGIPHSDASVDEVRLTGTFNAALDDAGRLRLVREAARVLKPGGKIVTHGLMGDRPLPGAEPKLPGLAALVARVPVQTEPLTMFREAGFVGLQVVKYTEKPWFVHDGVEMREVKVIAWKPQVGANGRTYRVVYKGPFRSATADGGWVFARGQRMDVPESVWNQLRLGSAADQFLFLKPQTEGGCSSC